MKWCNRTLFQGPYLALATTQREFDIAIKRLKLEDKCLYCNEGAYATTHTYLNTDKQLCCIVGLRLDSCVGKDGVDIAGLLVHEAVHVWQHVRSSIVTWTDPSRTGGLEAEMEAYAIQNIAQELMDAYKRTLK
jgi:hypothetical protein